jgi:hypothetical protein
MLKFTSVQSSEPQVRNPTGLKKQSPNSGFHKTITNLMEPLSFPFPSYQLVRDASQPILSKHTFYAWKRPQHLRPQWLILSDLGPAVLVDPRDATRMSSIKAPLHLRRVQHSGPIILEAAYDFQETSLYLWDVIYWEKENQYESQPYSKRWKLLQHIASVVFDAGNPKAEMTLHLPVWESLQDIAAITPDEGHAVDFQPEKAGQRRFLWIPPKKADTFKPQSHHERKMVADKAEQAEKPKQEKPKEVVVSPSINQQPTPPQSTERHSVGWLKRSPRTKLPEASPLESLTGEELGLPAIRRLELSKQLRDALVRQERVQVTLVWCEAFQKYEIRQIVQEESA